MLEPRKYQLDTVNRIVEYATENIRGRMLVVCPPGGGKTLIGALAMRTLVSETGLRGVAWAHRRELVGQMYDHLLECDVPQNLISVVMSGDKRHNRDAPIQIGSVDTIRHRDKPLADFVVSDEAHRDASDGRRRLRGLYPDAFHLGLTATPVRLDGRGLANEYEQTYVSAQPSALIEAGHIVAPRIFTVPPELLPDLRGVRKRAGDFREDELEHVTNRRPLVGSIVEHWKRRAEDRRTIVFPVSIRHSHAIVSQFLGAGIKAAHLDGNASHAEREALIAKLRTGSLRVLSSCAVLSEGINLPEVKCVVMARPTASVTLFIQQGGRCMRPWNDVEPLLLDHAGNVLIQKHFAPHADRPWTYESSKGKRIGAAAPMKECPACHLVVPAGRMVCDCGAKLIAPSDPTANDSELVEYRTLFTDDEKRAGLERIRAFAAGRGFPESWVTKVFAAQYGHSGMVI